jgi:asparagine synthase (glutamine-hydrolysing)
VALAHRRLSILDLSAGGRQPIHSACGRYALISNGEIYNFRALRRELEGAGCVFRSYCDTEVMLAAIAKWGLEAAIEMFDGMFAFALWDRRDRLLHLGRDRLGEKPLYYGWSGGAFVFGSELKALRLHPRFDARVDRDALTLYLRYAYIPAPYSIYRGIRKVMPGSIVTLAADGCAAEPYTSVYWTCKGAVERGLADPFPGSTEEATEQLAELLEASVKLRMVADVPVGAFLSGGYDSSTIVSLMRRAAGGARVKTFTLGFEEKSEAPFAREVARHLGTDHIEAQVTAADALQVIPRLPQLYDEPFSDSSQIATFLISLLARREVSVVLTGDGSDELFCGYQRYDAQRFPGNTQADRIEAYRTYISMWTDPARVVAGAREPATPAAQPERWLRTSEFCNQMMYLDSIAYLPDDLLVKMDRAAMAVGLETRVPCLDHRVFEFVWRLPFGMKVNQGQRKWILRQVLYRDVPAHLVDRPKQGFEVPLKTWLTAPLRDWAESLLEESRLRREGFFDPVAIRESWSLLPTGPKGLTRALWSVLMFQAWIDHERAGEPAGVATKGD